ncbi:MAG: sigma-54-dependent Fis family transcriptional regulator [Candidatus Marinimicrobia bacterium]|jgi:two-component system, NtrC family, response regulator AtoC|nr:sigma-54-dependent Fis family transcriptional regulator [Candidatus Neomarinimicrobiota bacterium]MBT3576322.1 sigma-54-dependent Fis family transcriptional regulator [Candidatus Neomarinimicrobiota bacterium]MBT3825525.1 sigma-54-dependent Fis family transcriptional regulator [Candidatus Neomarinimicrobiota bacterium]MBT4129623.1 sigma-54-dependent Fis family transcriptional regulator [Candidatus Neomarinimicrobiota bacterium]MBT4294526.1 sigma-54-dependent Fis family transcriptional regula
MVSIHIIDDDAEIREVLRELFESDDYEVSTFNSAEDAHPYILRENPDLILLDIGLPGMDGLTYLEKLKNEFEDVEVIMITGQADLRSAIRAIKLGAMDYIRKPIDPDELKIQVNHAIDRRKKREQLNYLQVKSNLQFGDIVGTSQPMEKVYQFIYQVAESSKTTVLIRGETGTGKGLVARSIHNQSPRAKNPFIEVNCSAIQPSLLESELFGHEAGAFTDAKNRKKGLLELAHDGTFFLDEVGDMNLASQSKLLKVLEEKTFRRVGGTKEIKIDARIISASSRDLMQLVEEKTFRADLYYRLNVASVRLPALRDRNDDILILANYFLEVFNKEFNRNIRSISPEALKMLTRHPWVGNVREIRNVMERAVLFEQSDVLSSQNISLQPISPNENASLSIDVDLNQDFQLPEAGISLEELEQYLLKQALERSGGNKTKAAALLGLSRETMKYRLKKFKLS